MVGLDNLNDYYDPQLKRDRLARLQVYPGLSHAPFDMADRERTRGPVRRGAVRRGGQPGGPGRRALLARQSRTPTWTATWSASSTSSRAAATPACSTWSTPRRARSTAPTRRMPFSVHDNVDHPVSLYAATKKANELMAHTYSHLYRPADHGPALLHRLRPLGPAGHGPVPVHQGDPRGPAHRRLQPRQDAARLHLHRRHRRGRGAGDRPRGRAQPGVARRPARPGDQLPRPTGSTTSATTAGER